MARLASSSVMGQHQSRNLNSGQRPPRASNNAEDPRAFVADLPPLGFHCRVHGDNIRLEEDGFRARRVESFCNVTLIFLFILSLQFIITIIFFQGVLFTDRPVNVGERVCLRVTDLSAAWDGFLRVGFAAHNPNALLGVGESLPKYACPDLTKRPGFWAKALANRHAETGAVIHFYVSGNGDVHFGLDGEDAGVFFSGVDTRQPLWGMVDLYGNCTGLELLDSRRNLNNFQRHQLQQQQQQQLQHQLRLQDYHRQQLEQMNDQISTLSIRPVASEPPPPAYVALPPPQLQSVNIQHYQQPPPPPVVQAAPPPLPPPNPIPPQAVSRPPPTNSDSGGGFPALKYNRGIPFRQRHFHFCTGKNAKLAGTGSNGPDGGDVAFRSEEEFAQGYVFTALPIRLGERIVVQVLSTEVGQAERLWLFPSDVSNQ